MLDLPELDPQASEADQIETLQAWIDRERKRQGIATRAVRSEREIDRAANEMRRMVVINDGDTAKAVVAGCALAEGALRWANGENHPLAFHFAAMIRGLEVVSMLMNAKSN